MSSKTDHVYEIFIQSTPERVWQALTDPDLTERYYFGTRITSDFVPGAPYVYHGQDGAPLLDGTIVESDPPRRLVMTFRPLFMGGGEDTPVSRVTWEIEPDEEQSRLRLIHEGLDPESDVAREVRTGWAKIISAMKTVLETQREPALTGS